LKKSERIIDACLNVRFAHNSLRKIPNTVDRIKEIAKSGPKFLQ